jgi:uncharacterized membrane protein
MFRLHSHARTLTHGTDRVGVMHNAEHIISWVLRGGVLLSAGVITLGLALFASEGARVHAFPHTLPAVINSVTHGDPLGIIVFGLLLLLCTPVLRVAVSIIAFAMEGDRRYVAITSLVMTLLLLSMTMLGTLAGGHLAPPMPAESGEAFIGIFAASVVAGLVGSLVGLGGGVFVVPLLAAGFGMPIEVAIGASVVSVIATSSGAAAAYVRDHLTNSGDRDHARRNMRRFSGCAACSCSAIRRLWRRFACQRHPTHPQVGRGSATGCHERQMGFAADIGEQLP